MLDGVPAPAPPDDVVVKGPFCKSMMCRINVESPNDADSKTFCECEIRPGGRLADLGFASYINTTQDDNGAYCTIYRSHRKRVGRPLGTRFQWSGRLCALCPLRSPPGAPSRPGNAMLCVLAGHASTVSAIGATATYLAFVRRRAPRGPRSPSARPPRSPRSSATSAFAPGGTFRPTSSPARWRARRSGCWCRISIATGRRRLRCGSGSRRAPGGGSRFGDRLLRGFENFLARGYVERTRIGPYTVLERGR